MSNTLCSRCGEPPSCHSPSLGCRYQGWSNYETWAVNLWLNSEEHSQAYWREAARFCREDGAAHANTRSDSGVPIWTEEQAARYLLADRLQEEVTSAAGLSEPSVYSALLGGALESVNWQEIATAFLEP